MGLYLGCFCSDKKSLINVSLLEIFLAHCRDEFSRTDIPVNISAYHIYLRCTEYPFIRKGC